MAIFSNPENILKRAEELIKVGQKREALQVLHDLITSRIFRSWQKPYEKVMLKYVELCVDLKRVVFAKDGLIQYRGTCQQVNVTSFEEVTKYLLLLATEKAELVRNQDGSLEEALDVDDIMPEDLQLSILSGEKENKRSESEVITKFLSETFTTVLEILRNNSKFEELYAMTAYKAFQFCKQYNRTTEFRRLCGMIRNHLANYNKFRDQRDQPDLTSPDTLKLYLNTRFEQLKVATELGLSQEAFRSVEDIYGLMCMVKKTPQSSLLVVYYSKLAEIFWISSSNLYHAYALFKLFSLQRTFNKNLSQKELQLLASSVVLAALSVPTFSRTHSELENEKDQSLKIANLIRFNLEPEYDGNDMLSRESLLSELVTGGVLSCATQEVKDLYHLMEHEFHPLDLGSKIKPLLDRISKLGSKLSSAPSLPEVKLSQYVPSLEKLATLKLLKQVSEIYQTIRIKSLAQLVPFFDFSAVEKISVDAVKNNYVSMKVDHVKGVVNFKNLEIESHGRRDPLAIFSETMNKVRAMLFPSPSKASNFGNIVPKLGETIEKEHKRLLARTLITERRKEEQELQLLEKVREEEQTRINLLKLTEEAEQKRLARELEERRRQRILREIDEEKVTKQTVMERAMKEKLKEYQEKEKKLRKLVKFTDYLERAKREEAAPLIEAAYQQRLIEEKELYEREAELSQERHEHDLMEKNRLARMSSNKDIFQNLVISVRQAEFDILRAEKEELTGQIIEAKKQERDIKRKKIYYLKCEEERIAKLQEQEEASKLEEAEKHRKKVILLYAEAEKHRKKEAERKAKLDEIAERQRQRAQEIEEKEKLRREALLRSTSRSSEPKGGDAWSSRSRSSFSWRTGQR